MSNQRDGFWSEYRVERLKVASLESIDSTVAIGRQLNCSKNAIIGKAHRLGLPLRGKARWHPKAAPQPAWFASMLRGGCTYDLGTDELGFDFCNEPLKPGSCFCPAHHALCRVAPGPLPKIAA